LIVTITLNPVLEVEYVAAKLDKGTTNQVRRVRYRAGGRGLAVARVLHTFGHDVVAGGLAGGSAGELIRNELARAGVATQFTRIAAESRRVVAVTDESDGQVTRLAEPAPYITTEELGRLAADYRALLTDATAVVLCGSLPEGLPAEIYGSFTGYAAQAGVPVILDAGGSARRHALGRGPELAFCDFDSLSQPDQVGAADEAWLAASPNSSLAVPAGRGVRLLNAAEEWRAENPGAEPGSGSADALIAGFVAGVALGWSWPDTLRHAVAIAGAWDTDGQLDEAGYEQVLAEVNVERRPLRRDDSAVSD
jgi:tagatose 6-phosphate kinase